MLNDFTITQHTRLKCIGSKLHANVCNWLMISALGSVAISNSGCSSNHQFASTGNWFSSTKGQASNSVVANQPSQNRPLPSHGALQSAQPTIGGAPSKSTTHSAPPSVTTVSYTEPTYPSPATISTDGSEAARVVPAQLAGLRRSAPQCAVNGEGCGCQNSDSAGDGCGCGACQLCQSVQRGYDAQEYICDGGDLDPATIVRKDWSAVGVDTTDTVMYYETAGGKVCVKPSNRTCVYAPRFGAVRQVTGAMFAENALSPNRVYTPVPAQGLADINRAGNMALTTKIVGQKQVQVLDRFVDQRRGVLVDSVVPPTPVGTKVSPQINVDRTLIDVARVREWPDLIGGRIEVLTLINPESLAIEIGGQEAVYVADVKSASEIFLYETPDGCSMRLTKTASHQHANSGDRIRFTIRFENVGTQKLGNAVILDSLSPRLNYIEGSQQCSVEARFSIEPNESGSNTLRWDIQSPIDAQQSGVVSFDCEVR